ncbi:MAG: RHS repeat-associated core domain-containing protein [Actinomycetota bacterium]
MPATGELFFYEGTTEKLTKTENLDEPSETLLAQGPNGPLAQEQNGDTRFFLKDLHGDVVGLASENPGVTGSGLYDPYGDPIEKEGERTVLGFQGDYTDSDTGLVDMGARDYAPGLGRFTSMDPLAGSTSEPDTLNGFGYGESNPITYWDPTGLLPCGGKCHKPPPNNNDGNGGSGGNGDPQSGSVVAPDPKWGGAKRSLALSLSDFDEMTVRQRLKWLDRFVTYYELDEWLDAIKGVLVGFEGERFLRAGRSWASAVDASILKHLQDGMRLVSGRTPRGGADEGSRRWRDFFLGYYRRASEDQLKQFWGRAEMASTQLGVEAAQRWGRVPRNAEIALFGSSESFRQILSTGSEPVFVFGRLDPRNEWVTAWATRRIIAGRPYTYEEAHVRVPIEVAFVYDALLVQGVLP